MDLGLAGRVAMIGGGSRGLGFAVARALVLEGASVSIASRDAAAIGHAADKLRSESGGRVQGIAADLSDSVAIRRWHAAVVDEFGGIDLLYVNTGGPPPGAALDFDDHAWQAAFDLLVMSAVRLARAVVPSIIARGGGAILVGTSSSVKEPIPDLALSTVLRASVAALAKTLALELAASRIRVNHLIPGRIETERLQQLDARSAERAGISVDLQRTQAAASIPLGRYGKPDEFGRAAAFLLSDAASYITGATLQVDGGAIQSVV